MRHTRHYSVAEANALRPWVAHQLEQIRESVARLEQAAARTALERAADDDAGGYPGRDVAADAVGAYLRERQLDVMDVIVRDLDRGLVDFPSVRRGQEVYLCWSVDEPSIEHWHHLDAGAAGRQDL